MDVLIPMDVIAYVGSVAGMIIGSVLFMSLCHDAYIRSYWLLIGTNVSANSQQSTVMLMILFNAFEPEIVGSIWEGTKVAKILHTIASVIADYAVLTGVNQLRLLIITNLFFT